jgi:uncharacterized protein DUF4735
MLRWLWLALSLEAGCSSCREERPLQISVTPPPVVSASTAPLRGGGTPGAVRGGTLPSATLPSATRSGPLPDWDDARSRALAWIEGAGELGIDALVFVDAAGKLAGDARAREVVTKRRATIPKKELARYEKLLDAPKPSFAIGTLEGVEPSASTPDSTMPAPQDDKGNSIIEKCLGEAVACKASRACVDFASDKDRWGYVLAHQGAWLLLSHWSGCTPPVDVDELRSKIGASLVKETKVAGTLVNDLFVERLAILGALGFAKAYEGAWIEALRAAQDASGCWRVMPGQPCSAHTTALALLALEHARKAH